MENLYACDDRAACMRRLTRRLEQGLTLKWQISLGCEISFTEARLRSVLD